jgi:thiosulfate dehydrogenase (quinone) large subunit
VTLTESDSSTAKPHLAETHFDRELAYGILRFTLGINILLHGLLPLTNLESFTVNVLHLFTKTPLSAQAVRQFAIALPFAQTVVGLLLTLGLWTRLALVSGGLVMAALVFGTALRNDGPALGILMLYAAIYYLLLTGRTYNRFSIDHLRRTNCSPQLNKRNREKILLANSTRICGNFRD